jgi:rhodanese-related sulfurtransferase
MADQAFIDRACAAIAACGRALRAGAVTDPAADDDATKALKRAAASQPAAPAASHMAGPAALDLDWATLPRFLANHPGAQLVDVREPFEYLAGQGDAAASAATPVGPDLPVPVNVPLGQVPQHLPGWLAQPEQLVVFFCRSGNRSLDAALHLLGTGHAHVRHLRGGLVSRMG